jgi:SpoVK/Ycf46/Vps4 family AAA+-type ATPase
MLVQYVKKEGNYEFHEHFSVEKKLPSGVYKVELDAYQRPFLVETKIAIESYVQLPNSPVSFVKDKINEFLTEDVRKAFDKFGMIYKRGILLYGPPGTGKTAVVNQIIDMAVKEKDMVVLLCPHPNYVTAVVQKVREIEKTDRQFLVVWEEFEGYTRGCERQLLSLLDGITQLKNMIYLATTNYIDQIPQRIINRPSRFADIVEIGLPSLDIRRIFLTAKLKREPSYVEEWAIKTEGLTIDHIKDVILNVFVFGLTLDDAVIRAKNLLQKDDKSDAKAQEAWVDEECDLDEDCEKPISVGHSCTKG